MGAASSNPAPPVVFKVREVVRGKASFPQDVTCRLVLSQTAQQCGCDVGLPIDQEFQYGGRLRVEEPCVLETAPVACSIEPADIRHRRARAPLVRQGQFARHLVSDRGEEHTGLSRKAEKGR